MDAMEEDERKAMAEKFEDACTGAGDAILADTAKDFEGEAGEWSAEDKENFKNVLVPEYFEFEE